MIPGATPETSRCLFSGALIEAFWGNENAIDLSFPGKVTPGSLADYLLKRVNELGETYGLNCSPESMLGWSADPVFYFDASLTDKTMIPLLGPWPAPINIISRGAKPVESLWMEKGAFGTELELTARLACGSHTGPSSTRSAATWALISTVERQKRASSQAHNATSCPCVIRD
jgi:hypothetical protein